MEVIYVTAQIKMWDIYLSNKKLYHLKYFIFLLIFFFSETKYLRMAMFVVPKAFECHDGGLLLLF